MSKRASRCCSMPVAALKAEGRSFELTLIGDGPLRGEIEAQIRQQRLGSHVRLAGFQSNRAVSDVILGSRALVLPSFAEGLPVVLMEAMALGRPVLATNVAGVAEPVEPGKNGWLVPADHRGAIGALRDSGSRAVRIVTVRSQGSQCVAERHNLRRRRQSWRNFLAAQLRHSVEPSDDAIYDTVVDIVAATVVGRVVDPMAVPVAYPPRS